MSSTAWHNHSCLVYQPKPVAPLTHAGCAVALFIIIMLSTPINRQLALVHIKGPDVVADIGVLGACYRVG